MGTNAEMKKNHDYPFYMSLTRSKLGEYSIENSYKQGAVFELDGDAINQHFKGGPVDYWDSRWLKRREAGDKNATKEMEDRVFSYKQRIPIDGLIKSIHIYLDPDRFGSEKVGKDTMEANISQSVRHALMHAKTMHIPAYFYTDKKSFLLQNKAKAIPLTKDNIKKFIGGSYTRTPIYSYYQNMRDKRLMARRELFWKQKASQLSAEAKKLIYNLAYHNYNGDQLSSVMADLHNNKKRPEMQYMANVLRRSRSKDIKEYLEKMAAKWNRQDNPERWDND
jgi:hypothetical protein